MVFTASARLFWRLSTHVTPDWIGSDHLRGQVLHPLLHPYRASPRPTGPTSLEQVYRPQIDRTVNTKNVLEDRANTLWGPL